MSLHPKCNFLKTKDIAFYSRNKACKKLKKIFECNKQAFIENQDEIVEIEVNNDFSDASIEGKAHLWFHAHISEPIKIYN